MNEPKIEKTRLKRVLVRFDVVSLGFGAMIGWGWVILAGLWISQAGFLGASLAFFLGSIAIIVIGLTYAELASALPFAGGEHAYTERAFGKTVSFICTWSIIFGYVSVVAFEAIALPVAVVYLFPEFKIAPLWVIAGYTVHASEVALGAGGAILITVINILGVRVAARVQSVVLILILLAGLVLLSGSATSMNAMHFDQPAWKGLAGLFSVIVMVPFLFVGFDVIPQSAEEINAPKREIGRALVQSILFAVIFYLLIVFSVGLAPASNDSFDLAAADAAGAYWNSRIAAQFLVIAGIGGILTSWNAFLIGGSRAVFALARSGQLPAFLGKVHPGFGTPWPAILLIGILSVFAPMLGRNALVWIVNAGGFSIVVAYLFVAAAFLKLRRSEPLLERPYKTPGGVLTGIAALILSIALLALYLPGSPAALQWPHEWGLLAGWFGAGLIFLLMARNKSESNK
jgi:basic amino acid/polyamine antiporter, APA family